MLDKYFNQSNLRVMTAADLDGVLALRNHAEIRRYMLTQHVISMEEHVSWFEHASQNSGIDLLIFEIDGVCRGFVQLKEIDYPGVVTWGFYVHPNAPKGAGRKLGLAALDYAFKKNRLHKVCGQALNWNRPSIQFHKSLGFTQEGILRNQHSDGINYHDLICFGILKDEWVAKE
jgi:UDP-4-amino-4,6-dideoxy-N-acetyl-beta-L-altrosamine N-acetyltransferase